MDNSLAFLYAAAMGDIAALEREYSKNRSILSARNPEGRTALHLAAEHARPAVLRLLLNYGMCAAVTDTHGQTPLHIAAQGSSTEAVDVLLREGSGCSARDSDGKTAIAYAYQNPTHDILVRFLDYAPSCGVGCSLTPEIVLGSRPGVGARAKSDSAIPCARASPAPPKRCCGSVRCK
ncbi:ankyrin repeat-containing domain protein [Aspergillus pseudoustus]|uniref:Ankyrin repeat-containing domain protein n=1 Tax=Aspergillus pseudoustus TaxID=1810923 RepID=A0ABR4JKM1_9EURO